MKILIIFLIIWLAFMIWIFWTVNALGDEEINLGDGEASLTLKENEATFSQTWEGDQTDYATGTWAKVNMTASVLPNDCNTFGINCK
jgi:hypothetical protein